MTEKIYRACLVLAGLCVSVIIVMLALGWGPETGIFVVGFFTLIAIGIRGLPHLRGFSFTIWVFAAVSLAMFYPQTITEVRGYNTEGLIVPLVQLIMFGMGTAMSIQDFVGVINLLMVFVWSVVSDYMRGFRLQL